MPQGSAKSDPAHRGLHLLHLLTCSLILFQPHQPPCCSLHGQERSYPRTFVLTVLSVWQDLSSPIHMAYCLTSFSSLLKCYLLREPFPDLSTSRYLYLVQLHSFIFLYVTYLCLISLLFMHLFLVCFP